MKTPNEVTSIQGRAAGNLAFLMSSVRCGEQLSDEEENIIRGIQKELYKNEIYQDGLTLQLSEALTKLDHAEDLLRQIREHDHCKVVSITNDWSDLKKGLHADGHRCAAAIASRAESSVDWRGMCERQHIFIKSNEWFCDCVAGTTYCIECKEYKSVGHLKDCALNKLINQYEEAVKHDGQA